MIKKHVEEGRRRERGAILFNLHPPVLPPYYFSRDGKNPTSWKRFYTSKLQFMEDSKSKVQTNHLRERKFKATINGLGYSVTSGYQVTSLYVEIVSTPISKSHKVKFKVCR
ncbi:hypothetical protein V6N13_020606 [Hibiscus sabdariffa]|uniref:Uncharacterized protein n=1 Tax=Hibiscus sabdariffa TaxID=183260 RepID=A0ABR2EVZ2_9ROSI